MPCSVVRFKILQTLVNVASFRVVGSFFVVSNLGHEQVVRPLEVENAKGGMQYWIDQFDV
jgi:hypothetical protein